MPVTIDEIIEAATNGVLRALDARKESQQRQLTEAADVSTTGLVQSGFFVDFRIRAGGIPPAPFERPSAFLNPQPLPPKEE